MIYNSFSAFSNALERLRLELPSRMVIPVRSSAANLADAIRNRVSKKGEGDDGGDFSPYTVGYTRKKLRDGSGQLGRKIDKKNFYLTGTMWESFGNRKTNVKGTLITTQLNFMGNNRYLTNPELNDIHSDNEAALSGHKGIAYPNADEEQRLVDEIEEGIWKIITEQL